MEEATVNIIFAIVAALGWLFWTFFSDTRYNHGILIAFLLPLALFIIPVVWFLYIFVKYSTYLVLLLLGRRQDHAEFIRKLRDRCGIFL